MNNSKKTGILWSFAPGQSLKTQGIGRLLCFLISGAKDHSKFIIAIPKRYKNQLIELFEDHHIHQAQYDLLMTSKAPYLLRVINIIKKHSLKKKKDSLKKLSIRSLLVEVNKKIVNFFIYGLTSSSLTLFLSTLTLTLLLLTSLITSLFFIPFLGSLLFISLLIILCFFIWKFLQSLPLQRILSRLLPPKFFQYYKQYKKYFFGFYQPLKSFNHMRIAQKFYEAMRKQELNKLIKLINSQSDIQTWFIPTLFWPEISKIKAFTVVAAPDIVFLDFPSLFANDYYHHAYQKIIASVHSADHFICYSHYVKQQHLIEEFQLPHEKVSVIPHGSINLAPYLAKNSFHSMTDNAMRILKEYQRKHLQKNDYLSNFDFTHTRFIFYSSHIRPYKNFLNLLKAYEILLRQKYLGIKLIITGNIADDGQITDFIKSRRISHDVLSFHQISSDMLAALNHLAICAVNPSLFEGGFPFTFSEAYSVGTPSVMSKIAAVEEIIDLPELQKMMLFDPYSVNDMVEKMAWAIEHPDELYEAQKPLYEKLVNRSWEKIAEEYLNVFDSVAV